LDSFFQHKGLRYAYRTDQENIESDLLKKYRVTTILLKYLW
jgi:hypothetical protein